jgi:hypothetical protein
VSDYADWNRLRRDDYAWQTEGDAGFRLRDTGLRAVRTGFGVYRGRGGTLQELDVDGISPRTAGLTYGYLEGEFGISEIWSLVARTAVGLGSDGVKGGGQFGVRIGNDRRTNLLVAGEILGEIGLRASVQLEFNQFHRVPLMFRSEVTNQPVGTPTEEPSSDGSLSGVRPAGEVGVRLVAQAGYRVLPELVVALRGSYQGRTIRHAGPGGGAALTYHW